MSLAWLALLADVAAGRIEYAARGYRGPKHQAARRQAARDVVLELLLEVAQGRTPLTPEGDCTRGVFAGVARHEWKG